MTSSTVHLCPCHWPGPLLHCHVKLINIHLGCHLVGWQGSCLSTGISPDICRALGVLGICLFWGIWHEFSAESWIVIQKYEEDGASTWSQVFQVQMAMGGTTHQNTLLQHWSNTASNSTVRQVQNYLHFVFLIQILELQWFDPLIFIRWETTFHTNGRGVWSCALSINAFQQLGLKVLAYRVWMHGPLPGCDDDGDEGLRYFRIKDHFGKPPIRVLAKFILSHFWKWMIGHGPLLAATNNNE